MISAHIEQVLATLWCSVNRYPDGSGSFFVRARTGIHWNGSKYSRVRTGTLFTTPSRSTVQVRCSMCGNGLFQFCAVTTHTTPISIQHEKLYGIVRTKPWLILITYQNAYRTQYKVQNHAYLRNTPGINIKHHAQLMADTLQELLDFRRMKGSSNKPQDHCFLRPHP